MKILQATSRFCYTRFNSLPVIEHIRLRPESKINRPLNYLLGFRDYEERMFHFDHFKNNYSNTRKSLEGIVLGNATYALSMSLYPYLSPLVVPGILGLFLLVHRTGLAGHLLIKQTDRIVSWLFDSSRLLQFAGKYLTLSSFVFASYKLQDFFITENIAKSSGFSVFPGLDYFERLVLMSRISFGGCFFGLGLSLVIFPIGNFLGMGNHYDDIFGK